MDIWTIPFIVVVIIISTICIASMRKTSSVALLNENDGEIPKVVEEHPFTLNPIIWVILVATVFTGIIIFYYATSFY